jgi:hypothetical protein
LRIVVLGESKPVHNEEGGSMTITLTPPQEAAVRAAIRAGQVASVEEFLDRALAGLSNGDQAPVAKAPSAVSVFEQGLGLFGSPEDAALLDEVVSIAYEERRRPSQRNPSF